MAISLSFWKRLLPKRDMPYAMQSEAGRVDTSAVVAKPDNRARQGDGSSAVEYLLNSKQAELSQYGGHEALG